MGPSWSLFKRLHCYQRPSRINSDCSVMQFSESAHRMYNNPDL